MIAAAGAIPGSRLHDYGGQDPYRLIGVGTGNFDNAEPITPVSDRQEPALPQLDSTVPPTTQTQASPLQSQLRPPVDDTSYFPGDLARHNSEYGQWMAPVATPLSNSEAGLLGLDGEEKGQQPETVAATNHQSHDPEASPNLVGISTRTTGISPLTGPGGHEIEVPQETGEVSPQTIKHDRETSISALHVPGKY